MKIGIGSISHGTFREEDLIPCFLEFLVEANESGLFPDKEAVSETLREISARMGEEDYYASEAATWDLNETLWELLCRLSPPYTYFGSHPGDGSDFGYWVDEDQIDEDVESGKLIKVSNLGEVPPHYDGIVWLVDEYGATLYKEI